MVDTFGYEYALRLDFSNKKYTVYTLGSSSTTTVYYEQNKESNPWRYHSGGSITDDPDPYGFKYSAGLSNSAVGGLLGDESNLGTHYAVALNLAEFLTPAEIDNFIVHFTMGCGNDNLMGMNKNPVPEPASILLVGAGLIGLIGYNRKRYNKKIQ
ncbi:MAG: PEP-CTERM sorting domain-containing protein [Desulfosarcina sp.]|nr:PEP-CTERM sorting domain-containing protein [Desulfobacterales bacterium]